MRTTVATEQAPHVELIGRPRMRTAGCTLVMKPSELTPLTALKLCELVVEADFPSGVVNTLPGLGAVAGAAIASHHAIDKVRTSEPLQRAVLKTC